ncbi:MAG: hypothetical protein GXP44_01565 [bacterium]|nr:hypothetical protein [bacterium]
MKTSRKLRIWFYGLAGAVVLAGVFSAGFLIKNSQEGPVVPGKVIPLSESLKVDGDFVVKDGKIVPIKKKTAPEPAKRKPVVIDISPEAIANWDTCRNEKYGYEFKYPKGWYVYKRIPTTDGHPYTIQTSSCEGKFITLSRNPMFREGFGPPTISIWVVAQDWTKSAEEYFNENISRKLSPDTIDYYPAGILKKETLGEAEVIYYYHQDPYKILIHHKTDVLILKAYTRNKNQSDFLDAVFSTFKFIK